MAHDASHHHASTEPGFDRKFIDVDQRNEIKELLEAFDNESHGHMTVIEVAAILSANGYFDHNQLMTMFEEEGMPFDEQLTQVELKNVFAKNFRTSKVTVHSDESGSEDEADDGANSSSRD